MNFSKQLLTTLTGVIVGAGAMYLLAPRSGAESRTEIKRRVWDDRLSSWGNYPKISAQTHEFETVEELLTLLQKLPSTIARGNGRSYGDSSLAEAVISGLRYNKFLDFDPQQGIIRCQAGVLLSDILDVVVPQGWFLPVTPGTKLITVGGAIASNVHGKSQHKAGNFSDHLIEFELMQADGEIIRCSPTKNAELFWMTNGGMGLTGIILNATLRLIPVETAFVRQESIRAENLDQMMALFEDSEDWTYSVAWLDYTAQGEQLGRGFLMRGEHATVADLDRKTTKRTPLMSPQKLKLAVPINFPELALNQLSVKIFNTLLFHKHPKGTVKSVVDYDAFFYPLDVVHSWNRVYGYSGFVQYQFVLPKQHSRVGMRRILEAIAASNQVPFLVVLKLYKDQHGSLPFSVDGYSLALDFPVRRGLWEFLEQLDEIVLEYGGRLYLTKDARMSARMFRESYPDVPEFQEKLHELNNGKFRSLQSNRLGLT